jgi:multidrug efflux system outer membrane protein
MALPVRSLLAALLSALAFSTGAFAQPAKPEPAAPIPPAAAEEPKLPEVDDPMLKEMPPAPNVVRSWQQAILMVRSQSTSLRIAAAQAEQARAQARQALSGALPSLTGTGSINHHLLRGERQSFDQTSLTFVNRSVPDPATTWQAGLGLRVPVFAPQAWYDYGTAKQSIRAARLNAKETQRLALAATAESIVTVVTTERLAEVSRVSLSSALSTNDLTQKRARLGAASALDVLRTEQEVQLARAQVVSADESARRAREALGLALGSPEPWSVTPAIRLDALAADARSSCRPERTIEARPDVRAAQAGVEIAERNVSSVDWTYLPTVDFVSNLTYLSHDEISPNNEHVTWTIGGVLTWTLYDGGLRYGTREANEWQSTIAREQLTQAKRQAKLEVMQATRGVVVAETNLKVSTRSRDIAKETARLSRVAFVNGTGTSFDLVDTARRLREAELDLAIKEFEVVRAKVTALLALATCDV